jgi:hypothetical protein
MRSLGEPARNESAELRSERQGGRHGAKRTMMDEEPGPSCARQITGRGRAANAEPDRTGGKRHRCCGQQEIAQQSRHREPGDGPPPH